jgi:hypothetical protein
LNLYSFTPCSIRERSERPRVLECNALWSATRPRVATRASCNAGAHCTPEFALHQKSPAMRGRIALQSLRCIKGLLQCEGALHSRACVASKVSCNAGAHCTPELALHQKSPAMRGRIALQSLRCIKGLLQCGGALHSRACVASKVSCNAGAHCTPEFASPQESFAMRGRIALQKPKIGIASGS